MIDTCYVGDVRDGLRSFVADGERAQCIVTSPPYWGLRSYLPADHPDKPREIGQERVLDCLAWARGEPTCRCCYVCTLRDVFVLASPVLKDDGTLWINMGDSYIASAKGSNGFGTSTLSPTGVSYQDEATPNGSNRLRQPGLKQKDICGQPWRLALALQADGWYWRDEIIWHKRNCMPSSQKDRTTRAHEIVLMFSKSERYFYDHDAIKEPASPDSHARAGRAHSAYQAPGQVEQKGACGPRANGQFVKPVAGWANGSGDHSAAGHNVPAADRGYRKLLKTPKAYPGNGVGFGHGYDENVKPRVKNNESFDAAVRDVVATRMKRSVWDIPSRGYKEAHFATFPPDLVAPMILAGSRIGDVVLDPFFGSGTVGEVARSLGRHFLGCDLNPNYAPMQHSRTAQFGMPLEVAP